MLPTFKSIFLSLFQGDKDNVQVFLRSCDGTRANTKFKDEGGVRVLCVPCGLRDWAALALSSA